MITEMQPTEDNNRILTEVIAQRIKQARKEQSAEFIVEECLKC